MGRRAVRQPPSSLTVLAETLFKRRKEAEGLDELRKLIAAAPNAEFEPEDRELQQMAVKELARRTKRY